MTRRAFLVLSRTNFHALSPAHSERLRAAWGGDVQLLDRDAPEPRWRGIARLVRDAGRYDAVVLDGSVGLRHGYMDQLAAGIIGRRRDAPVVVIGDCQWKRGSSWLDRTACSAGIRVIDNANVTYCVHSEAEVELFPVTWGVDPDRVAFTPWPYILRAEDLRDVPPGEGVFAGGDSLRDYEPLLAASRGLPTRVTIATRRRDVLEADLPENVDAASVSHDRFVELMRAAAVVVVPLARTDERSAGQTTYVNGMALGKLVVVTDRLGVRSYIRDRENGLIVRPDDPRALHETMLWALDPANARPVSEMRAKAREEALGRLHPDEYAASLLRVARRQHDARNAVGKFSSER